MNYSKVRVNGLYSGIDLIYYGGAADGVGVRLPVIHPHADPGSIRFEISGADGIRVDSNGDLVLVLRRRKDLRWHAPLLYQMIGRTRVEVAGHYELSSDHRIRFEVGKYDRSRDPDHRSDSELCLLFRGERKRMVQGGSYR